MNKEEAKNKLMTIYGSLSEELKQAIDVLVDAPTTPSEFSEFADKLYKLAYERGKREAREWIPVTEKMPEERRDVLFCDIDGDVMIGYHIEREARTHFTQCGSYDIMKNVKAWMPLPAPYKQEGKE